MESTTKAPVSYRRTKDEYIVSIKVNTITHERLLQLLEIIRLEILGKEIAFDPSVEALGKQIKADWWAQNKDRLLNRAAHGKNSG